MNLKEIAEAIKSLKPSDKSLLLNAMLPKRYIPASTIMYQKKYQLVFLGYTRDAKAKCLIAEPGMEDRDPRDFDFKDIVFDIKWDTFKYYPTQYPFERLSLHQDRKTNKVFIIVRLSERTEKRKKHFVYYLIGLKDNEQKFATTKELETNYIHIKQEDEIKNAVYSTFNEDELSYF